MAAVEDGILEVECLCLVGIEGHPYAMMRRVGGGLLLPVCLASLTPGLWLPLLVPRAVHAIEITRGGGVKEWHWSRAIAAAEATAPSASAYLFSWMPRGWATFLARAKQGTPLPRLAPLRALCDAWWNVDATVGAGAGGGGAYFQPWHHAPFTEHLVVPDFSDTDAATAFFQHTATIAPLAKIVPSAQAEAAIARLGEWLPFLHDVIYRNGGPMAYILTCFALALPSAPPPPPPVLLLESKSIGDEWLRPLFVVRASPPASLGPALAPLVSPPAWADYVARAMIAAAGAAPQRPSWRFSLADLTALTLGQLDCTADSSLALIKRVLRRHATLTTAYTLGGSHLFDQAVIMRNARARPRPPSPIHDAWARLPYARRHHALNAVDCLRPYVSGSSSSPSVDASVMPVVRPLLEAEPLLSIAIFADQDRAVLTHGDALALDNGALCDYRCLTFADMEAGRAPVAQIPANGSWFAHVVVVHYHAITSANRANTLLRLIAERRATMGFAQDEGSITFVGCPALALAPFWRPALRASATDDFDVSPHMSLELTEQVDALIARAVEQRRIQCLRPGERPPLAKAPAMPTPGRRPPPPPLIDPSCFPRLVVRDQPGLVTLGGLLTADKVRQMSRQQLLGFLYRLLARPNLPALPTYMSADYLTTLVRRHLADPKTAPTSHWLDSD